MALPSMPQGAILDVVTSGQIGWDGLKDRVDEPFKSLGAKCLVFGNGDDDLEVRSCARVHHPSFVIYRCTTKSCESPKQGGTRMKFAKIAVVSSCIVRTFAKLTLEYVPDAEMELETPPIPGCSRVGVLQQVYLPDVHRGRFPLATWAVCSWHLHNFWPGFPLKGCASSRN